MASLLPAGQGSKGCSGGLGGEESREVGTGTLWWPKEQTGEGGSREPSRLDGQSRIQGVAVKEGRDLTQGTERSSPMAPFSILGEQMREWRP